MKKIIFTFFIFHCSFIIANALWWEQVGSGMIYNDDITSIVFKDNVYFASASNYLIDPLGYVYISENNCLSWTQTSLHKRTFSLIISGNSIFAGTDSGVYVTTNNGTNWTQTGLYNKTVEGFAVSGNNIFAGTSYSGIYRSTDNGMTWAQTAMTNNYYRCFAVDGNNIFAGGTGLYFTTNNGANWTSLGLNQSVISIGISGNTIYAGTEYAELWQSTNYGLNWVRLSICYPRVGSIAIDGNNIFIGGSEGVFLSSNNGLNWVNKNQGFNYNPPTLNALLIANNYIFAGDVGATWRRELWEITGMQNTNTEIPSKYSLSQNYPNPFNPVTKIKFDIKKEFRSQSAWAEEVKLSIYDILGRKIKDLVNENLQPGSYEVTFDGSNLPSGVYFYQLRVGDFVQTRKLVLLK